MALVALASAPFVVLMAHGSPQAMWTFETDPLVECRLALPREFWFACAMSFAGIVTGVLHRRFVSSAYGLLVMTLGVAAILTAGRATERCSRAMVDGLARACEEYRVDFGAYPAELYGGLVRRAAASGSPCIPRVIAGYVRIRPRFLRDGAILDGWGRPIRYRLSATGADVWSLGPDGVESPDDLHGRRNPSH